MRETAILSPWRLELSILFTILIGLTLFTQIIRCDLQQINDKPVDASTQDGHHNPDENSQADDEYIKRELKELIKTHLDKDKDGAVSYEELKKYHAELHDKTIEYNVDKQWDMYKPQIHEVFSWEGYEPEKKEVLTWDHYYNQTYPELVGVDVGIPINREQDSARILEHPPPPRKEFVEAHEDTDEDPHIKALKLMVRRADARWRLADENGDTLLTKPEFKNLLHPDEAYEELQNLFVRESTEDMDDNKDGNISLEEFMKHVQHLASDHEKSDKNWLKDQQENFGRYLDKNKDGVLDKDEIRDWLVPPKSRKYAAEAKRLLEIGDVNEDHKLSSGEILERFEQFVGLLPPEYWHTKSQHAKDDQEEEPSHQEL